MLLMFPHPQSTPRAASRHPRAAATARMNQSPAPHPCTRRLRCTGPSWRSAIPTPHSARQSRLFPSARSTPANAPATRPVSFRHRARCPSQSAALLSAGFQQRHVRPLGADRLALRPNGLGLLRQVQVSLEQSTESTDVAAPSSPAPKTGDGTPVPAQMPGKVIRHLVQPGDHVEAGDGIIVLEAMKMEMPVTAPRRGHGRRYFGPCRGSGGRRAGAGAHKLTTAPQQTGGE